MALKDEMLDFRARNNYSQRKAAELAHITCMTWGNVERGIQSPSKMTEKKIRNIFNERSANESISITD